MAVSSPCPLGRRSSRTAQFLPRPQTCEPQWGWVCACGISFSKASGRTIQPYRKKWFTRKTPQRLDTFICRFSLRSLSFFATFLYHKNILVFLRPVKLEKKYCDKSCSLQLKWWLWRFFHSLNSLGERERVCVCIKFAKAAMMKYHRLGGLNNSKACRHLGAQWDEFLHPCVPCTHPPGQEAALLASSDPSCERPLPKQPLSALMFSD